MHASADLGGGGAAAANAPLRVLLVEDSALAREVVRGVVESCGATIELIEAEDLASASKLIKSQRFDCAVLDYLLPDGDGLAFIGEIKANASDVPIVILTAHDDEHTATFALQAGAQDYLVKGRFDGQTLLRSIRYAIERKRAAALQMHLLRVDRMVALGTLAAGVAHEINNPLTYVMANVTQLQDNLARQKAQGVVGDEWRETAEMLEEIRVGADRVRAIVRDMRTFTRPDDHDDRTPVDIASVLDQAIAMTWNDIRHRARLVKDYRPAPAAEGSAARLGQVFVNLLINAAQAIPDGNAPEHEIRVRIAAGIAGDVEIRIEDTGLGIAPENLRRVFDPFFTTKPVGTGTGLGLFICEGIVHGMGGTLSVESAVGRGTRMTVRLPVARSRAVPPSLLSCVPAGGPRRRVLVVDDDAMVLVAIRRLLGEHHDLVTTTSALEAVRRIKSGERFDVLIADLMMPCMSGMELYEEVVRVAPELAERTIFVTGGAFTANAQHFLETVPNVRLEKPFDARELREIVSSIAERPAIRAHAPA